MADRDEVYYCGHCRRQQDPSKGEKCRDCGKITVSWDLRRESESDALRGIERSIADVSARTGAPCATFAFPNGNYTAGLAQHALECGVSTVMTTEPMWAGTHFPPWRLPRLQLFGPQSRLKIDLKLALAATGHVLANPDGTGRLYRKITRRSAGPGPGATPIHVEARRGGLHVRRDYSK